MGVATVFRIKYVTILQGETLNIVDKYKFQRPFYCSHTFQLTKDNINTFLDICHSVYINLTLSVYYSSILYSVSNNVVTITCYNSTQQLHLKTSKYKHTIFQ